MPRYSALGLPVGLLTVAPPAHRAQAACPYSAGAAGGPRLSWRVTIAEPVQMFFGSGL